MSKRTEDRMKATWEQYQALVRVLMQSPELRKAARRGELMKVWQTSPPAGWALEEVTEKLKQEGTI